jgi:signal transduction histidine kinase
MITNAWFASNQIISTRLESRFFYRVDRQALGDRRVLLNPISNGFYAATKCKANGGDYEPTLAATTMSPWLSCGDQDSRQRHRHSARGKGARHNRDEIVVAVEDSGPGIDPKKLDGIFDPFVSTKPQGMGLGLAICRMIIDRHGGQLSAWSGKKRGAVFQFILPAKSAMDQIAPTA